MTKLTPKKLATLAARRHEVTTLLAALTKEKAQIDAQLEVLEPGKFYETGDYVVSRTPRAMLDADLISKEFPPSQRPELYKLTLDTAEFKRYFSPVDQESYQKISYVTKVVEA